MHRIKIWLAPFLWPSEPYTFTRSFWGTLYIFCKSSSQNAHPLPSRGLLRDCKTSCNLRQPSFQALEYTDKTLGLACSAAGAVALLLGCLSGQESCSREYVIKVSCIRSVDILTLGPIEWSGKKSFSHSTWHWNYILFSLLGHLMVWAVSLIVVTAPTPAQPTTTSW